MKIYDNISDIVRDDLLHKIKSGSRISVAAACYSMYAYRELFSQVEDVCDFRFIYTSPTFDFTQWRQIVLFSVFFLTLGILCVKHNHFSTNIVLELLGYRFYRCELINEDDKRIEKLIVSKELLINHKNEDITTRAINNEFSLDLHDW